MRGKLKFDVISFKNVLFAWKWSNNNKHRKLLWSDHSGLCWLFRMFLREWDILGELGLMTSLLDLTETGSILDAVMEEVFISITTYMQGLVPNKFQHILLWPNVLPMSISPSLGIILSIPSRWCWFTTKHACLVPVQLQTYSRCLSVDK